MDYNFKTSTETPEEGETVKVPEIGGDLNFKTPEGEGEPVTPEEPNATPEGNQNITPEEPDVTPEGNNGEGEGEPTERGQGEPETPNTITEITQDAVTKFLSDKLGMTITEEDFSKLSKAPEVEDEYITKLKEWRNKTGRPIEEWVEYTKDYSKLNAEEVLKIHIKREYPELTDDQVELELDNWLILEDIDDESTQRIKELKLAKELPKIRKQLEEEALRFGEADSNLITPELREQLNLASEIVKDNELLATERAKDKEIFTTNLESRNNIPIKLGDDLTVDFKINTENKGSILKYMESGEGWHNEDGSINHNKIIEDATKIVNFDAIVKMVYEQGKNVGIAETLKTATNTDVQTPNPPQGGNVGNGPKIEGIEQMLGRKFQFK